MVNPEDNAAVQDLPSWVRKGVALPRLRALLKRIQKLRNEHPGINEGWRIVKKGCKSHFIKKFTRCDLYGEALKKKMEKLLQRNICKSLLEEEFKSRGDKEYEGWEDQKENPFCESEDNERRGKRCPRSLLL